MTLFLLHPSHMTTPMKPFSVSSCAWVLAALLYGRAYAQDYYVDCSASSSGTGTKASPWNSLDSVNSPTFKAGDVISFRKGSTCSGVLKPKGSGAEGNPVRITAYQTDDDDDKSELPIIDGKGVTAAVTLTNQDYWVISNLKVTNPASKLAARQGIHVTANDGGVHKGIKVVGNRVDDVAGQTNKEKFAWDFSLSCAILVDASASSRYDDVTIQENTVTNAGGGGIKARLGTMSNRGNNVHVTLNKIDACGGDGIVVSFANKPLLDYNTASNLGKGTHPWTGGNFAGIWVLGDYDPVISHNVVFGSIMSKDDSMAYDCDWGNEGTCLVEYNFSRDNAGGAFLNCDGCDGGKTPGGAHQILRYNIFQNDCRMNSVGQRPKMSFYNNVMYCPDKPFNIKLPPTTRLTNNIFVGDKKSSLPARQGLDWKWNVFYNVKQPTNNGFLHDPGFVDPGTGGSDLNSLSGYQLKNTSVALANGEIIENNGGQDFFGNPVSNTTKPNRGAYSGPGVASCFPVTHPEPGRR